MSFHFCIFILLLFFICWCSSFTFSFRHDPSPFRRLSSGFYTHFVLSAQPIAKWFATLSFSTIPLFSYSERYGFEWAFFTHKRFLPSDIFRTTCFQQGFSGSQQLFLEICRASYWSSKHRPGPSVCLIYSNPQYFYILNLYLYMSTLQKFYLWWKIW